MQHPFCKIGRQTLGNVLPRLTALLLVSGALMALLDTPLRGEASPWGIVSFELAGTPYDALRILLAWEQADAIGHAKLIQWADFVYLIIYGSFFATLAAWAGAVLGDAKWSSRAAWAATLAALFDVLENVVLLFEIQRMTTPAPWPQLAAAFATTKFALLALSTLYGLVAGIRAWRHR